MRLRSARGAGDDGSSLDGREQLGGMEAQDRAVAVLEQRPSVEPHAHHMRRVVDHAESVLVRHRLDPVHVAGVAEDVHRQDRPRLGTDQALDARGVQRVGPGVDVAEDRGDAVPVERMRRGGKRERRGDDLAAVDPESLECDQQRHRPVAAQAEVRRAQVVRQRAAQLLVERPLVGEPPRVPDRGDALLEGVTVGHAGTGDEDGILEAVGLDEVWRRLDPRGSGGQDSSSVLAWGPFSHLEGVEGSDTPRGKRRVATHAAGSARAGTRARRRGGRERAARRCAARTRPRRPRRRGSWQSPAAARSGSDRSSPRPGSGREA